jgi:Tfp pilus assembly protein PilF
MAILQDYGHAVGGRSDLRSRIHHHLDQAIAADPDFALAYVRRALLYASQLNQDPGTLEDYAARRTELESLALSDLETALAIDSSIGVAYGALAQIHQLNWRGAEAQEYYGKALSLNPNDPDVLMAYAVFCSITGRRDKAVERAERAITLDPNSVSGHMWLAFVHLQKGDLKAAVDAERGAVALSPTFGLATMVLGHMERLNGNFDAALTKTRLAEELLRDDTNPVYDGELVANYATLGYRDDAERVLQRMQEAAKTRVIPTTAWAIAYVGLGDAEQTLRWLTAAAENPEPYIGFFSLMNMKSNRYLYPLLEEPQFRAVRDRLGFPDMSE